MTFPLNKWFAYFFLFLNSQMLFQMGANPMGIRGLQEIFLALVVIYSIIYIADKTSKNKLHYLDLFIFVLVITFVSLSAVFAYVHYGQPIVYGIIEARITFAMFIYFPLRSMHASGKIDSNKTLKIIMIITIGIVVASLLIKFNIIPKSILPTQIETRRALRADRNSMGRFYMVLTFIYAFVMYIKTRKINWAFLMLLLMYSIFFILQEKQTMIGLILVVLLSLSYRLIRRGEYKTLLLFTAFTGGTITITSLLFPSLLNSTVNLLSAVSHEQFAGSSRYIELSIIFNEMKLDYGLLGHGSVWASWNDGFTRIFGELFFLGDVGIFGTIFRLGLFFFIPIFISTIVIFSKAIRQMESSIEKDVVILGFIYTIITLPTSAPIEYRGYFIGLLLALAISKRNKSLSR